MFNENTLYVTLCNILNHNVSVLQSMPVILHKHSNLNFREIKWLYGGILKGQQQLNDPNCYVVAITIEWLYNLLAMRSTN